jgi:phosphonate transport system ATP-binding protein
VPAPGTPAIRIRGLTKRFGKVEALRGVDLEVPKGELCVLVGLSGSGKSTLLRHINGLTRPTSGSVEVLEVSVDEAKTSELRRLRRRVGFIFQQFHLVGRVSVMENVLHGSLGRIRYPRFGVLSFPRELRKEALRHLERVGLADRAFQRADTLSGGQQQRVAIARSLMQEPEVLLADEPVASLDPESSANVMDLMFRICMEDALTVVCSLHQVELALGYAHRLVGLRDGAVVLDGPARSLTHEEVLKVYKSLESAGLGSQTLGTDLPVDRVEEPAQPRRAP